MIITTGSSPLSGAARGGRPQAASLPVAPGEPGEKADVSQLSGTPPSGPAPAMLGASVLASLARQAGYQAIPPEGKVAALMSQGPEPERLSPERAAALQHEFRVLDELGYLLQGHPDFPRPATHEQAFGLMEKGQPVYWREFPNSLPVPLGSWDSVEQVAREARQRTCR